MPARETYLEIFKPMYGRNRVGRAGLMIERPMPADVVRDLFDVLEPHRDKIKLNGWFVMSLISSYESREQVPLAEIGIKKAQAAVMEATPSLSRGLKLRSAGVGMIPRENKGTTVVLDILSRGQQVISSEVGRARAGLERLAEETDQPGEFDWHAKRASIEIGKMPRYNTADDRTDVRNLIFSVIPRYADFELEAVTPLPLIIPPEVTTA